MEQEKNKRNDENTNPDVTRSQNRQAQDAANDSEHEERPAGAQYKGSPQHEHGAHKEGERPRQSDDPTMHPSGADED